MHSFRFIYQTLKDKDHKVGPFQAQLISPDLKDVASDRQGESQLDWGFTNKFCSRMMHHRDTPVDGWQIHVSLCSGLINITFIYYGFWGSDLKRQLIL